MRHGAHFLAALLPALFGEGGKFAGRGKIGSDWWRKKRAKSERGQDAAIRAAEEKRARRARRNLDQHGSREARIAPARERGESIQHEKGTHTTRSARYRREQEAARAVRKLKRESRAVQRKAKRAA